MMKLIIDLYIDVRERISRKLPSTRTRSHIHRRLFVVKLYVSKNREIEIERTT